MKKAIYVSNTLFLKATAAVALLLTLSLSAAHAADQPRQVPIAVKYIGSVDGKPQFQITLENPQGEEATLTLRDENGVLIYSDVVKDKTYSRTLQFNALDVDHLKITLTLRTKKDTQTQAFEITKNIRTVEDVAVVSL